jgi:demethylmenaquinone methyltransferase/2-methoxy-6-polyprenyl-1,4-benzoquinol methylase
MSKPMRHNLPTKIDRKEFFNKAASSWDKQYSGKDLAEFLQKLVPKFNLARGQKILDVGTGTGILIPHLVHSVGGSGLIVAVDFAEKMIDICRKKYSNLLNVKFVVQNVEELDFPPDYFDAITCFGLFPHIENKQKALFKMNQVLKPKGKLIIAHALSSNEIREHHRSSYSIVANDVMPAEKEMSHLLKNAGFDIDHFEDSSGCYLCLATKKLDL